MSETAPFEGLGLQHALCVCLLCLSNYMRLGQLPTGTPSMRPLRQSNSLYCTCATAPMGRCGVLPWPPALIYLQYVPSVIPRKVKLEYNHDIRGVK